MALKPRTVMRDGQKLLLAVSQKNLEAIFIKSIDALMKNHKKYTKTSRVIREISLFGMRAYKAEYLEALSILAIDTWNNAQAQVGVGKKLNDSSGNITLASTQFFNRLTPKVQQRLQAENDLMMGVQSGDAIKVLKTTYSSAVNNLESSVEIKAVLVEAAEDYTLGASVKTGAQLSSAKIVNSVQNIFWEEDEVKSVIKAFKFENAAPETKICTELNGRTFKASDKDYQTLTPPLHFSCKSFFVPLMTEPKQIDGLDYNSLTKEARKQYIMF